MNRTINILAVTIFLFLNSYNLFAQDYPSISEDKSFQSITSPNASDLGRFGQIPVDLFSGQVNIQIPLYTVKEQNIEIPIVLSYNSNGNRVNQCANWTGLGWSLSAGGVITRKKNGEADDCYGGVLSWDVPNGDGTSTYSEYVINTGYYLRDQFNLYHQNDHYKPIDFRLPNIDLSSPTWSSSSSIDDSNSLGWELDRDPDEFVFNVNGLCGSFFLDPSGKWQVKSKQNLSLKVEHEFSSISAGGVPFFSKFKITDEKGIVYVFGGVESAIEHSWPESINNLQTYWGSMSPVGPDETIHTAMSWYLTEIMLPTGKKIEFTYLKNGRQFYKNFMFAGVAGIAMGPTNKNIKSYGDITYLKSITTENQQIIFDSSIANDYSDISNDNPSLPEKTTKYKLDTINIYKANVNTPLKTVALKYIEKASERLKLNQVVISGDQNSAQTYQLEYNKSLLPFYRSDQTDHWGYFNGVSPVDLTQMFTNPSNTILNTWANSKSANPTYAQAEMLTSIQYPTGGKSTFYYEGNTYSKVATQYPFSIDNSAGIGAGLRISKIVNDPLYGPPTTQEYFYTNNYLANDLTSSGVLASYPCYGGNHSNTNGNWFYFQNIDFSDLPLSVVTYTTVTEKSNEGYKVYQYSNYDNGYLDIPAITQSGNGGYARNFNKYTSLDLERGNLLSESDYNSSKQIVHKIKNFYNDDTSRFNKAINSIGSGPSGGSINPNYLGTGHAAYLHYYYTPYLKKTIDTVYYANSNIINIREYTYDNSYNKLKQIKTTDSRGNELNTYYNYPFDVVTPIFGSTVDAMAAPITYMASKNIIGTPIEMISTTKLNGVENVTNLKLTTYKGVNSTLSNNSIVQVAVPKIYFQSNALPVLKSNYSNYGIIVNNGVEQEAIDPVLQPEILYTGYDNSTNLVEFKNGKISDANDGFTSRILGYNHQYPVAQANNAKNSDIFYDSFEEGDGNSASGNAKTGHYSYSGTYTKSLTGLGAGIYTLSYWLRLGGAWSLHTEQISLSGNSYTITLNGQIDDVCFYPITAQMATYTYDPLVGMTSLTDAKELTTYYEYDGLNRLLNIRDKDKNIIKSFCYNYAGQQGNCYINPPSFSSAAQSASAEKNCGAGYMGTFVTYTVPAGIYTSKFSQQDADNQAIADVNANKQNYANINGTCVQTVNITLTNSSTDSYQVAFSGGPISLNAFNFNSPGSATIKVPIGTYSVNIYPTGTYVNHTISMDGQTTVTNVPRTIFNNVSITSGSSVTVGIH